MVVNRIVRNPFIGFTFDVVEMEYTKNGTNILKRIVEGVDFRTAQIIMGVDPDAPVRDADGDRV